jgi:Protein of unknown function (DUF1579)
MKRTALLVLLVATPFASAALAARARQESPKTAEHALLEGMAGTWNAEVQAGEEIEKGTHVSRLGLGGLWLTSDFDGTLMGAPFQGHEILGWDPEKKKYVGCWVDSMTSALTLTEGTWDAAKKTLTMESLAPDPMTGEKMVNVSHFESHDKHVFRMHPGSVDAPPMMTITYTRKK